MKLIELFGGVGACTQALKRLGIDVEIADYVEIDKYAVKSYNAINETNFEPQDITQWNKSFEDVDLIMHGSPCQDFSLAGKQAGGDKDSGTRSSLMYETIRIVKKLKPKYVVWENVKNLLSKNHKHNFDAYIETMEQLGYSNYYQVLNAKDYGIPQNRERVFTISIRHDINKQFEFPKKQELKLKLKDMLENDVDEKYYLSEKMIKYISADNEKWTGNNNKSIINNEIATTINTGEGHRRCDASNYICDDVSDNYDLKGSAYLRNFGSKGKIENIDGAIHTLTSSMGTGGGNIPLVLGGIGEKKSNSGTQWYQQDRIYDGEKIAISQSTTAQPFYAYNEPPLRIRKLTPKECWRLMGFSDECFEKASKVNSNAQLYKQAGNSIVVNVLYEIFKKLLESKK